MINGIKLKELRNAEYLQFMKDTLSLTNVNGPSSLNIAPQYNTLVEQVENLETLFKLSQASKITEELAALDLRRDRAITGISKVVDGYVVHFEPAKANAAKELAANLKLYGAEIARQNYQAETATINGIVSDWETDPELSSAAGLLGLKEWLEEAKAANQLFNQKYMLRTQEYGAATDDTITSEKDETNQKYYTMRDNIVARATLGSTPAYTKIINEMNALIEQYNALIRNREPEKESENETT